MYKLLLHAVYFGVVSEETNEGEEGGVRLVDGSEESSRRCIC